MVLLWLKSQVVWEGKWTWPIQGIILSHGRPREASDVLAHMTEMQTKTVLARSWNTKYYITTLSELIEVVCHRSYLGDTREAVMLFPSSFSLFIYSFIHSSAVFC